jgi:DTW domain-containing protein YfiP
MYERMGDSILSCRCLTGCCPCEHILALPIAPPPVKFVVVMHTLEFLRATNTGKILKIMWPDVTELLLIPIPEHEKRLEDIIRANHANTIALFPSSASVTVPSLSMQLPSLVPSQSSNFLKYDYFTRIAFCLG